MPENVIKLDLRSIPVFERHPRIFDTWTEMEGGMTLELINDHDPKPLRYQFEGEYPGTFTWNYVKNGPEEWVVDIQKLKLPEPEGDELRHRVEAALDEVRPYLQADGGDVELIGIDEAAKSVTVSLTGACGGCPSAGMTLKAGVEKAIKKHAPNIKTVESYRE